MKKTIVSALALAALLLPPDLGAQEVDVTTNVGWVSEYFYRGIPQNTSSASAGLDIAVGGLSVGTWSADVGDGAEVDLYGGYELALGSLSLSAGGTGYFYTGGFDDTYLEANFGAGYGPLSVEMSLGQWAAFDAPAEDYWFLGITAEHSGAHGTFGTFGSAFAGAYVEAGYDFTVSELDFSVTGVYGDKTLLGGDDDIGLTFGVGKTFSLTP
jgi:uncharacterized protein (TIGR02001 family)